MGDDSPSTVHKCGSCGRPAERDLCRPCDEWVGNVQRADRKKAETKAEIAEQLAALVHGSVVIPKSGSRLYAWGPGTIGAEAAIFLFKRLGPGWCTIHLGNGDNNLILEVFKSPRTVNDDGDSEE